MAVLQALLLASICCIPMVLGTIHDMAGGSADDLLEPIAVDISPDQTLGDIVKNAFGSTARSKRQSNGTDIGTTVRLNGTNRHYFALVHWTGHPSEVIFIVTMTSRNNPSDSCLWRSTDFGVTFTNDSYKFNDSRAVISWYYVSPYDQYLVMADTRQGKVFTTQDEGVTFVGYKLDFVPNTIRYQSRTAPNSDQGTLPLHITGYDVSTQSLYVSADLGESWIFLGTNTSRYAWRLLNETHESNTSLYFEKNINETHALLMVTEDPYTEDDMRELDPELGPIKINSSVFRSEYIMVKKYHETANVPLWVSAYRRPFRQANFGRNMQQAYYALMDASEHRIFLAVEHINTSDVHLYVSDETGTDYVFSLDHVVATENWGESTPSFDIHVVEGMDGVYLVNVYDSNPDLTEDRSTLNVKTLISYNKGSAWRQLLAPPVDASGSPTLCQPPFCSLSLRMNTDRPLGFTSILSRRSAVGLIVAQGNVGAGLNDSRGLLGVYISRDGGFTWSEVKKGHWSFQMVAHGSIIVMAPKRQTVDPLNFVEWSCDEGVTWTRYIFSETPMRLIGLLVQKGEKARRLTLFGYLRGVFPFAWLIVDLDFSVAVANQCSYPDDYFEWIPSDGRSDRRCVLGAERTFERRYGTSCCYTNPDYERAISTTQCPCSREDYECDIGYRLESPGGGCVDGFPPPPDTCTEGGIYLRPSGYRKVVGNVCMNRLGSQFLPSHSPCPPVAPGGLNLQVNLGDGDSVVFDVNQNITFAFSQESGWVRSTVYSWDFGDGTPELTIKGLENNAIVTHRYTRRGLFAVHVRATNLAGVTTASLEISIGPIPPVVDNNVVVEGDYSEHGKLLTFTVTLTEGFAAGFRWDMGDGAIVITSEHTTVEQLSYSYSEPGVYTVTVSAFNPAGQSSAVTTVHVGEVLPQGLNITVEGDTSKAGQRLTFMLTQERGLTEDTVYRWDFGDGSDVMEVTGLSAAATQIHTYDNVGDYTVRVTATNDGGLNSVSFDVTIGIPSDVGKLSDKEEERKDTGFGVGVALLVLAIVLIIGVFVIILFWYHKRYRTLAVDYNTLQEGSGPGPARLSFSLSPSEVQEDIGYSKEVSEADDKPFVLMGEGEI